MLLKISVALHYQILFKNGSSQIQFYFTELIYRVWAQRTTDGQHPSSVQIMVNYSKTSCNIPRPERNLLTVSLLSTFLGTKNIFSFVSMNQAHQNQ